MFRTCLIHVSGTIASSPSSGNNNTNESRRAPLDYLLLGAVLDRVCLLLYLLVLASFFISFKAVLFW
jgi:hypothetical protein